MGVRSMRKQAAHREERMDLRREGIFFRTGCVLRRVNMKALEAVSPKRESGPRESGVLARNEDGIM